MCKLKIDTQCGSLEQRMTLVKINSCKGLIVSLMLENKKFSWGLIFFLFFELLVKSKSGSCILYYSLILSETYLDLFTPWNGNSVKTEGYNLVQEDHIIVKRG